MRQCRKCKKEKPEFEFSNDKGALDGLVNQCKECKRKYDEKRKHLTVSQRLEREFGFLPGQLETILKSQDNKCSICQCTLERFCIDHDHNTGKFRSLLCYKCNNMLGMSDDDPELLRKGIDYIKSHKKS